MNPTFPLVAVILAICPVVHAEEHLDFEFKSIPATIAVDLGDLESNATLESDLLIKNLSGESFTPTEVKSDCGCAIAKVSSKKVVPGDALELTLLIRPGAIGRFARTISISGNAGSNRSITLEVSGVALEKVQAFPRSVSVARDGSLKPNKIVLKANLGFSLVENRISLAENNAVEGVVKVNDEGDLEVALRAIAGQQFPPNLFVKIDSPSDESLMLRVPLIKSDQPRVFPSRHIIRQDINEIKFFLSGQLRSDWQNGQAQLVRSDCDPIPVESHWRSERICACTARINFDRANEGAWFLVLSNGEEELNVGNVVLEYSH